MKLDERLDALLDARAADAPGSRGWVSVAYGPHTLTICSDAAAGEIDYAPDYADALEAMNTAELAAELARPSTLPPIRPEDL